MKVPIFKLNFEDKFVQEYNLRCADILTSNRPLGESYYVSQFETKYARLIGCDYAVAVSNGTAAIDLALRALNIRGKVAIPSNTFFATSVAVKNAGCEIVLIDSESESFSLCPKDLSRKLETDDIDAVIIVHIGGIISNYIKDIVDICRKHDVPLIEDAAHAHLSQKREYTAGTIGDIGCFSFFPTKVMTCGEGGMVTTNDKKIYDRVKSLKNFGRDDSNIGLCIYPHGINYKISEFTGLLGSMECDRVVSRVEKRNQLVERYVKKLKGSGYVPVLQDDGLCSSYKFITKIPLDREKIRDYCEKNGVTITGEVYKTPIHQQPVFKDQFKEKSYPVTDYICKAHICPPLYPELDFNEVDYVCEVLMKAEKESLE